MQQSSVDVTTRHAAIIQMMTVAGAGLSILSRACAVVTIWCLMIRCSRRSRYQFWCMTRLLVAAGVLVASGDSRGGECGDETETDLQAKAAVPGCTVWVSIVSMVGIVAASAWLVQVMDWSATDGLG